MALLLLIAATTSPARADCPAAPLANPDDMAISFLVANSVQASSASLLASSVKEGTLIYDDTANRLKVCNGTAWVDVGSGSDTLASLACASGEIAKYNGATWACAADGGGSGGASVAFHATATTAQTGIAANTATKIVLNAETFDTNGAFVPGSGATQSRFTPQTAGKYILSAGALCDVGGNGDYCIVNNPKELYRRRHQPKRV